MKFAQCFGVRLHLQRDARCDVTEACVCQDLALPEAQKQDVTDTLDYVQWLLGLEQGHGRLKVVPPTPDEFSGGLGG